MTARSNKERRKNDKLNYFKRMRGKRNLNKFLQIFFYMTSKMNLFFNGEVLSSLEL